MNNSQSQFHACRIYWQHRFIVGFDLPAFSSSLRNNYQ